MTHEPNKPFMVSLERLNPTLGYVKDNVVLCIVELNDMHQWSTEKIDMMLTELETKHDENAILTELNGGKTPTSQIGTFRQSHVYQVITVMA